MRLWLSFFAILFVFASVPVDAANTPCSGRKGGISHCQGATFVCNDGSVSASKKNCSTVRGGGRASLMSEDNGDMSPTASSDCYCRSGSYCTGPRGGRYCLTDSGSKAYLRR